MYHAGGFFHTLRFTSSIQDRWQTFKVGRAPFSPLPSLSTRVIVRRCCVFCGRFGGRLHVVAMKMLLSETSGHPRQRPSHLMEVGIRPKRQSILIGQRSLDVYGEADQGTLGSA